MNHDPQDGPQMKEVPEVPMFDGQIMSYPHHLYCATHRWQQCRQQWIQGDRDCNWLMTGSGVQVTPGLMVFTNEPTKKLFFFVKLGFESC